MAPEVFSPLTSLAGGDPTVPGTWRLKRAMSVLARLGKGLFPRRMSVSFRIFAEEKTLQTKGAVAEKILLILCDSSAF